MRIFRRGFWQFARLFWEIISSLVNSLKSFWRGRGLPEDNFLVKVRRVWRFAWKRIFVYATFWHLAKESLSWSRTVGRFSWKEVFFAVILKNIIRRKESFLKDSLETVLFWVDIECWKKKISSKKRKDWKQWLFKKKKNNKWFWFNSIPRTSDVGQFTDIDSHLSYRHNYCAVI